MKTNKILLAIIILIITFLYDALFYNVFALSVVKGNVKEELEGSSSNIPIEGIRITLKESKDETSKEKDYTTITDKNGDFFFNNVAAGNYFLEYKYGDITVVDEFPQKNLDIQNILKYNGQDYIATHMNGVTEEIAEQVIPKLEAEGAQVFFIVDTSSSMTLRKGAADLIHGRKKTDSISYSSNGSNGGKRLFAQDSGLPISGSTGGTDSSSTSNKYPSRIEIVKNASKTLIDKIFARNEDIYMGLVSFNSASRLESSLCRDSNALKNKIDALTPFGSTVPSDALEIARSNFTEDAGVKIVIFLSDGIPTEPEVKVIHKLAELRRDGIEIFSLIVKDDITEIEKIERIFGESSTGSSVLCLRETGDELVDCIADYIPTWIIEKVEELKNHEENEYELTELNATSAEVGIEDTDRRQEVDSYFSNEFHHNYPRSESDLAGQLYLFHALEPDNTLSKSELEKFSDNTYMTVTYKDLIVNENSVVDDLNIRLKRRSPFLMSITTKAVAMKITLSDGKVIVHDIHDSDDFHIFYTSMDNAISHGSMIEFEYKVSIKNNSPSATCNELEMLAYLPRGLTVADSQKMITNSRETNQSNGWLLANMDDLNDRGFIDNKLLQNKELSTKPIAMFCLDSNAGLLIGPGQTYETHFVASMCVDDVNQIFYDDVEAVEIVGYRNDKTRRMEYRLASGDADSGITYNYISLFPGDGNETHVDFAKDTNKEYIFPPTGTQNAFQRIVSTRKVAVKKI